MAEKNPDDEVKRVLADYEAGKTHFVPHYPHPTTDLGNLAALSDDEKSEHANSLYEKIHSYLTIGEIPQDPALEHDLVRLNREQWGFYFSDVVTILQTTPGYEEKAEGLRNVFQDYKRDPGRFNKARVTLDKLAKEVSNEVGYNISTGLTSRDGKNAFGVVVSGPFDEGMPEIPSEENFQKVKGLMGNYHKGFELNYTTIGKVDALQGDDLDS